MIRKIQIDNFTCDCVCNPSSNEVAYMVYPQVDGFSSEWLEDVSSKYGISIVIVYIPLNQWNDDLTPWPEPPEAKGFEPFAGHGMDFYNILSEKIIPQVEKFLGNGTVLTRSLIGVSLSGLFTLWQWVMFDTFTSIGCLSGSFWYSGFLDWFSKQSITKKNGKAYFLLGIEEPKATIRAYRTVGVNTEKIVDIMKSAGIECKFDWVAGNHFANPLPRAEKAIDYLFNYNITKHA